MEVLSRKCGAFRVALVLLALALLLPAGGSRVCAAPEGRVVFDGPKAGNLEDLTLRILAAMEARLRLDLVSPAGEPRSEPLRTRLIHLSMQEPLAEATRMTLQLLGGSKRARYALFFLMPAVRWMSEPFLYPVELSSDPEKRNREMQKVFDRIAFLQREEGISATLDNVGDAALSPEAARDYLDYYLKLARAFGNTPGTELCFSLKLSAFSYQLDKALGAGKEAGEKRAEILGALRQLLSAAAAAPDKRIFFRLDMEEYAYKDLTLSLFRQAVEADPDLALAPDGSLRLGVVIQAYLRDSAKDLEGLAQWARERNIRVPVRLVKGAYEKHEKALARQQGRAKSPVYNFKASTDACYEALSAYLLANRDAFDPAFATHNLRTMAHVMALARIMEIAPGDAEFQMLYGMGDPIKEIVVGLGYPMREYIPAGSLARGLGYAGRRFAELASGDNALARTMRGDFSAVDQGAPSFTGPEDVADGRLCLMLATESLDKR
ncbi:MAG: proline dehydrogenase family protein [Thermodesulfobacteriota bacterium]